MHRKIAAALLESVFFRVSAIVSLDEYGNLMDVALFSTDWSKEHMRFAKDTKEIWLISNHPDGSVLPDEQDRRNRRMLASMAGKAKVRLFLASEYFPCFETDMSMNERDPQIQ